MPLKKKGIHWYLTDEEVQFMRDQFNGLRAPETHNPGKWYVSAFNRKPEALGAALPSRMPPRVSIRDISLRVAEQTPGVALSVSDRRRLAQAVIEAGVPSLQISKIEWDVPPDVIREEIEFFKSLNPNIELNMNGSASKEHIKYAADLGINCASFSGPATFALSAVYTGGVPKMAWQDGRDWRRELNPPRSLDQLIARNKPLIDYAKSRGMKVQANLNLLHYATEEHIDKFSREMANAGVDYLFLADGPGAMGPHAIAYAVSIAKKAAPQTKIVTHLHNSFNLGVAVNLAAVQAGAEILELSVNGTCCAAGQTDIAHMVAALEILYGVDTGVKMEKLTGLRRLGEELFGVKVASNHPITGDEYFTWNGADLISQEICIDPLIHWCVEPSVVGNKRKWVIDRTSGNWSMLDKLTELGIRVEKPEVEAILKEVKQELLARKRTLTDDEIRSIALRVKSESANA